MSQPTIHQILGELTSKVDSLISGQNDFKDDISGIKTSLENLRAEDVRIDNRITLTMAVSKAYLAGWASAFTALGGFIAMIITYITGYKFP